MKLTIITVVKNDKKNLITSIRSVLSQSYKDFEYIIYDGASDDGTRFAIKKYLNKNFKYINRKDKNYYDGLNYAIKQAQGEYIGILNAGDRYYNFRSLQKIYNQISKKNISFILGNLIYENKFGIKKRFWRYKIKSLNKFNALKFASPTLFIKKKLANSLKYNENYYISSDTDFNIRLATTKSKFSYFDEIVIIMKSGGLSTNPKFFLKKLSEDLKILKNHFKFFFLIIYFYKLLIKLKNFKKSL